jgi:hypothetical protein
MIDIVINNIHYKLPMNKLGSLMEWLNTAGATKILENTTPNSIGKTLINE